MTSRPVRTPVKKLPGTFYTYLVGNKFVIFSNNVTMSREEFEKFMDDGTIIQKVESWVRNTKKLYDYKIALKEQRLQKIWLPAKIEQPRKRKQKEIVLEPEKKRLRITVPKDKKVIIFWVMLITAAGSALMSIYHATAFLYQGGKPLVISFITGFLLVVFASTGFTASRYFWERSGFAKIFSVPFLLITTVLIGYIAFSTTSVSYGQFRDEEAGTTSTVKIQISKLELYEELMRQVKEQEKVVKSIPSWRGKNMSDETWTNYQKRKEVESERLHELRQKAFKAKEESGGGTVADKQVSITSVYDFLHNIFGIDSVVLRFIIYVIPAVFYDIVAPFGFTVVFFLLDSKEKETRKEDEIFTIKKGVV